MTVLILASGRPAKPAQFFLANFSITLLALPTYYLIGGLLRTDALAFVATISVVFLVVNALRRLLQPELLSLSREGDGGMHFKGRFEAGSIPYSAPKPLASVRLEQGRLVLRTGESEQQYCLTTKHFQPGTLVALESLIDRIATGEAPDPGGFPATVRLDMREHRGNVAYLVAEKPSGLMLQFLSLLLGLACLIAFFATLR